MVLRLSLGSLTRSNDADDLTRVDATPLIELNENKVSSIEIFLYPNDATDVTDAVYATRVANLDKNGSFDLTLSLPMPVLESLFLGNATTCKVYAVANYATGCTDNLELTSVAELKSLPLEASFNETYEVDLTSYDAKYGAPRSVKPQQSFVMDSDVATVTKSGKELAGTVQLTRAASKITFRTTIAQQVVINGKTWVPVLDDLALSYHNLVNKGFVDNGSDTNNSFAMPEGEGVYANVDDIEMSTIYTDNGATEPNFGSEVEGASDWVTIDHIVPFYTYSSSWSDGAENEAHITMTIPWMVLGADGEPLSETLTYYSYFVPINMNDLNLVRNKHYRINLRVGVLGDIEIEQINDTTYSYEVIDWIGQDIEASLQKPFYLVVDHNYVELHNVTSMSVAYQSSGAVSTKVLSTTIKDWKKVTVNGKTYISEGCAITEYSVTADNEFVTFSHELDNTLTSNNDECDFLPQTTVVRVSLNDNTNIYQDITFVQYPAMHVTTFEGNRDTVNYLSVNGNEDWREGNQTGAGNGCPNVNGTIYWVGIGGKNKSSLIPDIYEVTVSSFDSTTSNYIIADPRGEAMDIATFPGYNHGNNSTSPAYAAQPDQRGARELKGYRPTLSGEDARHLIAPKFIIASFLSTCTNADQNMFYTEGESAWNRCAAYQEAGYPAGRWRIPTAAELEFIGKLCAAQMLPSIFTNDQNYPSSTGNYKYSDDGTFTATTGNATSVRCVYDTWYWRDKCKNNEVNGVRLLWGADGNVQDMKNDNVYDNYLQLVE